MDLGLLIFAAIMAGLAIVAVLVFSFEGVSEAWDISRRGWARGHREHHLAHPRH